MLLEVEEWRKNFGVDEIVKCVVSSEHLVAKQGFDTDHHQGISTSKRRPK
jgi:hypothetical protein